MSKDAWGVFEDACIDIDSKCELSDSDVDSKFTYKDLDKFLTNLRKETRKDRVLDLAKMIVETTVSEDCDEIGFLQACQEMIAGYSEKEVCIIKHDFNSMVKVGDVPAGSTLIIKDEE